MILYVKTYATKCTDSLFLRATVLGKVGACYSTFSSLRNNFEMTSASGPQKWQFPGLYTSVSMVSYFSEWFDTVSPLCIACYVLTLLMPTWWRWSDNDRQLPIFQRMCKVWLSSQERWRLSSRNSDGGTGGESMEKTDKHIGMKGIRGRETKSKSNAASFVEQWNLKR